MKIRLALATLLALAAAGCGNDPQPPVQTAEQQPSYSPESPMPGSPEDEIGEPKPQDEGFKMGTPVDIGGWQITVTGVKCGLPEIPARDKDYEPTQPGEGAEFCKVSAKTQNTGKRPGLMSAQNQFGWAGETVYNPLGYDTNADGQNIGSFVGYTANPGQRGTGAIWFEVPKGTVLTELEAHGNDALTNGTGKLISLAK